LPRQEGGGVADLPPGAKEIQPPDIQAAINKVSHDYLRREVEKLTFHLELKRYNLQTSRQPSIRWVLTTTRVRWSSWPSSWSRRDITSRTSRQSHEQGKSWPPQEGGGEVDLPAGAGEI
jgi:hypothetical protein